MFCKYCGCSMRDDLERCPRCNYPVADMFIKENDISLIEKSDFEKIADEAFENNPAMLMKGISEFKERTGSDLSVASEIMGKRYRKGDINTFCKQNINCQEILNNALSETIQTNKIKKELRNELRKAEKQRLKHTVHCPRCHSTSISYCKKPSLVKALLGYGVAGDAGAIIGSTMGKKGYAVCLNCGKTWKI